MNPFIFLLALIAGTLSTEMGGSMQQAPAATPVAARAAPVSQTTPGHRAAMAQAPRAAQPASPAQAS